MSTTELKSKSKIKIDTLNISATSEQIARMRKEIKRSKNTAKALVYAGITSRLFNKVMKGGIIKKYKLDLLLEFCETVEGANQGNQ